MPDEEFTISCPHCGQHLSFDASMFDQEFECPSCGKAVRTPPKPESRPECPEDSSGATDKHTLVPLPEPATAPVAIEVIQRGNVGEKRKCRLRVIGISAAFVAVSCIMITLFFGAGGSEHSGKADSGGSFSTCQGTTTLGGEPATVNTAKPKHRSAASAESLCNEFLHGGNAYRHDGDLYKFWYFSGTPFERIGKTIVRWDRGGEKPPNICEIEFLNNGTVRVMEDNTFFAREFRRNTLAEVADALEKTFDLVNRSLDGVVSVTTTVTDDGHLLFTAVIEVSSGNVSDRIGNTLFGMAKCRTALRM